MNKKIFVRSLAFVGAVAASAGSALAEGTIDFTAASTTAAAEIGPAATAGLVILGGLVAVGVAVRAFGKTGGRK